MTHYDLITGWLTVDNPDTTRDSETILRDLTADELTARLAEHGYTLPSNDSLRGRATLSGGLQLTWQRAEAVDDRG